MKRIPRKLKKIAKRAIEYGTTDFFNRQLSMKMPIHGVAFYILNNKKNQSAKFVIKCGKKIREAYYNGLFDF